ncbi:MAG: type II secretory pathway component GspD/PulD (secretin) [Planctomycetota bacterium]|jgi:type II secretory pathway component GspD/PulD (secretin)
MLRLHILAVSAALLVAALPPTPPAASSGGWTLTPHEEAFPTPAEGLTISQKETHSLEHLISEFQRVSGEQILYSLETKKLLASLSPTLHETLEVAPKDVYSVVQDILIFNRFVLADVRRSEPRMLSLVSLDSSRRSSIRQEARFVPEEQLDDYAMDSALLITTVIQVPNVDIRTIGNSLRQLVVDSNTMQIVPVQESNQVIVTGIGKNLQRVVQTLRLLDKGSAIHLKLRQEQERKAIQSAAEKPKETEE